MTALAKLLVDEGVSMDCIDYQNMDNILHIAVRNNDVEMLHLFKSMVANYEILPKLAGQVNNRGISCFKNFIFFCLSMACLTQFYS